jgi:hypothetical protein
VVTATVSLFTKAKPVEDLRGITYFTQIGARHRISRASMALAILLLTACAVLNFIFR